MAVASYKEDLIPVTLAISPLELKRGDHIFVDRVLGLYQEHAIYWGKNEVGEQMVIRFTNTSKGFTKPTGEIMKTTLEHYLKGANPRIVIYDTMSDESNLQLYTAAPSSQPSSEVIKTAEYYLEHPGEWEDYKRFTNNCKTFCVYCKTRKQELDSCHSYQEQTSSLEHTIVLLPDKKRTAYQDEESTSLERSASVQRVMLPLVSDHNQVRTQRGPYANLIKQYGLTDEQLNSIIKKSDFPFLAANFDGVKVYSTAMEGLTPAEQADVDRIEGTQEAMIKCLTLWKRHDPSAATYKALLELLLKLGNGETASLICQHLIDSINVGCAVNGQD